MNNVLLFVKLVLILALVYPVETIELLKIMDPVLVKKGPGPWNSEMNVSTTVLKDSIPIVSLTNVMFVLKIVSLVPALTNAMLVLKDSY